MKKRLLIAIRCLDIGGAEKQVLELVRRIDKNRFEVCLATMYGGKMELEAQEIDAIRYVNLRKRGRFDIVSFLSSYVSLLDDFAPDIVYSHIGEMNLFSVWARPFVKKKYKLVWCIHSAFIDFKRYGFFFRLLFWLQKKLSHRPEKIVYVSESALLFHRESGYYMQNGVVVFNGVNTEFFLPDRRLGAVFKEENNIAQNAYVVGIAARIDRMKGFETLAVAARSLLPEYHNLQFVVAGDGDATIKHACDEILGSYANRFIWLGFVDDLRPFYNALDLFCLPSLGEAFGLSVAEAMSCNITPIVSDAGDMKSIVAQESFVFKAGDATELAETLEKAIKTPITWDNRAKIVEHFSINASVHALERELMSV